MAIPPWFVFLSLENKSGAKLEAARPIGLRAGDRTEQRAARSCIRRRKRRVIHRIERLEPKLEVHSFCDGESFQQRGVPLVDAVHTEIGDHRGERADMIVERSW